MNRDRIVAILSFASGIAVALTFLFALDAHIKGVANETVSAAVGKLECVPPYKLRSKEKKGE